MEIAVWQAISHCDQYKMATIFAGDYIFKCIVGEKRRDTSDITDG